MMGFLFFFSFSLVSDAAYMKVIVFLLTETTLQLQKIKNKNAASFLILSIFLCKYNIFISSFHWSKSFLLEGKLVLILLILGHINYCSVYLFIQIPEKKLLATYFAYCDNSNNLFHHS